MAQEVRLVVEVDQHIHEVGFRKATLDQAFCDFYRVRPLFSLQGGQMELSFVAIDGERAVLRHPPIYLCHDARQIFVQLSEVYRPHRVATRSAA